MTCGPLPSAQSADDAASQPLPNRRASMCSSRCDSRRGLFRTSSVSNIFASLNRSSRSLLSRGKSNRSLLSGGSNHQNKSMRSLYKSWQTSDSTQDISTSTTGHDFEFEDECDNDNNTHWGEDEEDYISFDRSEQEAVALLLDINKTINKLSDYKITLEEQIESGLALAKARYDSGSTRTGSLVAMRRASRHKALKTNTVAARFEMVELRKRVQTKLDQARMDNENSSPGLVIHVDLDSAVVRQEMDQVLEQFHKAKSSTLIPSDESLLQQLQELAC